MQPPGHSRLSRLYHRLRGILGFDDRQRLIVNASGVRETTGTRRALVIYVAHAFTLAPDDPRQWTHQNLRQCRQIVAALGRRGFVVDVIDVRNRWFRARRHYNLVLSNRVTTTAFRDGSAERPTVIFLATTREYRWHNAAIRERYRRLTERGRRPVAVRRFHAESTPILEDAAAIVAFGNDASADTWRARFHGPVLAFNNYGFAETVYVGDQKDYSMAVRNYLCFGGDSPIVRGLDLLLEIFPKHPDLHLHVCGGFRTDPDFCATYREALDETPNVHAVGYVPIDDPRFYDLIRRCAWMIYPTASEGQSGSVVQCMHAGIIPIVTREAGLDVQDFGFVLADDSLAEIERTIRRLAATPEAECLDRTRRTRTAAERDFSEGAFAKRWEAILDELLPNASSR